MVLVRTRYDREGSDAALYERPEDGGKDRCCDESEHCRTCPVSGSTRPTHRGHLSNRITHDDTIKFRDMNLLSPACHMHAAFTHAM